MMLLVLSAALLTPSQDVMVKDAVKAHLRDPDSARFRNLRKKEGVICGEVASRNGFGGYGEYTTFLGFFSDEGKPVISPVFGSSASKTCEEMGL